MDENIDILRTLGIDEIYKDTHIPVGHLKAILESDFSKFSKLQFLGFIAILEREYELDLSEFKDIGISYIEEREKQDGIKEVNTALFVPPAKKVKLPSFYIILVACIILLGGYLFLQGIAKDEEKLHLDEFNASTTVADKIALIQEINSSKKELNTTSSESIKITQEEEKIENIVIPQEKKIIASFVIHPKMRVWFGYIDLTDYKRYQKTFKGELHLDPSKEWLLTFGHGYVDIIVDGEIKKFTSKKGLKFHYKDGEVTQITNEEFKRYNRGRAW